MKTCKKCLLPKRLIDFCKVLASRDGLHYMCRSCLREYRKSRRHVAYWYNRTETRRRKQLEYNRRFIEKHPERRKAHVVVAQAIKKGLLVRLPCEVCRDFKSQAHHHDYNKPLDVIWLCFNHHKDVEAGRIEAAS